VEVNCSRLDSINSPRICNNGDRNHAVFFLLEFCGSCFISYGMDFDAIAKWIQSQVDVDFATARQYAMAIGDTPVTDAEGMTVVTHPFTGKFMARIKLDWTFA
jgi:hypothetical protein